MRLQDVANYGTLPASLSCPFCLQVIAGNEEVEGIGLDYHHPRHEQIEIYCHTICKVRHDIGP